MLRADSEAAMAAFDQAPQPDVLNAYGVVYSTNAVTWGRDSV